MEAAEFTAPQAGRVIRTPEGYAAFVPQPLPPAIEYTPELVRLLSAADAALSELSGLGRVLPNPHLLIAPTATRGSPFLAHRRNAGEPGRPAG